MYCMFKVLWFLIRYLISITLAIVVFLTLITSGETPKESQHFSTTTGNNVDAIGFVETFKERQYFSKATRNKVDTIGFTFVWKIKNLDYCWLKKGDCIKSPEFYVDSLEGTKWSLRLFPKGVKNDNLVTVFLKRETDYFGPNTIGVKYHIAFLGKDGSILEDKPVWEGDFENESTGFFPICRRREKVFDRENKSFLPGTDLTVQCKLWKKTENPIFSELKSVLTTFKVHQRSFVWNIGRFSAIRPARRRKFKYDLINLDLFLNERLEVVIDIYSSDCNIEFCSFMATIIDSKGRKIKCGNARHHHGDLEKGIQFKLPATRNVLMKKMSRYLPNDVLSLDCQCVYTTVNASHDIGGVLHPSLIPEIVEKEKYKVTSSLWNGSEFMRKNATVELRTSTKSFAAHKAILRARSTVFRKMLSSDIDENSGHVDVTDLDDETVHRMLMYMYKDSLGDLQMESASKLYLAANNYGILSLKRRCSSFLKNNLYSSVACDVLGLARKHQDDDLESAVRDYILKHRKEVSDLLKSKHAKATNPQLSKDVQHRKVFKKVFNRSMCELDC